MAELEIEELIKKNEINEKKIKLSIFSYIHFMIKDYYFSIWNNKVSNNVNSK